MSNQVEPNRICFVVAPIGEAGSQTRQRSDRVLKIIERALATYNFSAIRADKIATPGIITTHMIEHLINAPLVIADLTDRNPNVYYELGIRHAVGKPYLQLIKQGQAPPFDVAAVRTIFIDDELGALDAVAEIERSIAETLAPDHKVTSPVTVALPGWRGICR